MKKYFLILVLALCLASATQAQLTTVTLKILNSTGSAVTGSNNVTLSIFDSSVNGNLLWNESYSLVSDSSGLVSVIMGLTNPLNNIVFDDNKHLQVQVGSQIQSPRIRLTSFTSAITNKRTADCIVSQDGTGDFNGLNDTPIKNCLNQLNTTGGRVLVKRGIYNISTPLTIPDNVTLQGEGIDVTILQKGSGQSGGNADTIRNINVSQTYYQNIVIKDLTVDGSYDTSTTGRGIHLEGVENSRIENVKVFNTTAFGITIGSPAGLQPYAKNVVLDHVIIQNNARSSDNDGLGGGGLQSCIVTNLHVIKDGNINNGTFVDLTNRDGCIFDNILIDGKNAQNNTNNWGFSSDFGVSNEIVNNLRLTDVDFGIFYGRNTTNVTISNVIMLKTQRAGIFLSGGGAGTVSISNIQINNLQIFECGQRFLTYVLTSTNATNVTMNNVYGNNNNCRLFREDGDGNNFYLYNINNNDNTVSFAKTPTNYYVQTVSNQGNGSTTNYITGNMNITGYVDATNLITANKPFTSIYADSLWQNIYSTDDGLVLYYQFGENVSLRNMTLDKSSYGIDASILRPQNSLWATGKYGNAISFNNDGTGSGSSLNITDNINLKPTKSFTMMLWMNVQARNTSENAFPFGKRLNGGTNCNNFLSYGFRIDRRICTVVCIIYCLCW